jgi:hypothetical protein
MPEEHNGTDMDIVAVPGVMPVTADPYDEITAGLELYQPPLPLPPADSVAVDPVHMTDGPVIVGGTVGITDSVLMTWHPEGSE